MTNNQGPRSTRQDDSLPHIRICSATQTYYGDRRGWWKYDWPSRKLTRGGSPTVSPLHLLGKRAK